MHSISSLKVRLSSNDLDAIINLFHQHFLQDDKLWIFGSRTDLTRKGGDIDLYVETNAESADKAIKMKANYLWDLEKKIGEQKVDLVLNLLHTDFLMPIYQVAKKDGVLLV